MRGNGKSQECNDSGLVTTVHCHFSTPELKGKGSVLQPETEIALIAPLCFPLAELQEDGHGKKLLASSFTCFDLLLGLTLNHLIRVQRSRGPVDAQVSLPGPRAGWGHVNIGFSTPRHDLLIHVALWLGPINTLALTHSVTPVTWSEIYKKIKTSYNLISYRLERAEILPVWAHLFSKGCFPFPSLLPWRLEVSTEHH